MKNLSDNKIEALVEGTDNMQEIGAQYCNLFESFLGDLKIYNTRITLAEKFANDAGVEITTDRSEGTYYPAMCKAYVYDLGTNTVKFLNSLISTGIDYSDNLNSAFGLVNKIDILKNDREKLEDMAGKLAELKTLLTGE